MMLKQLKEKFGDCKFQGVSDCIGSYELTSAKEFYIYDPPNEENRPAGIVPENDIYQLKVVNTNAHQICFVKTDKCLFTDEVSKCDCLLFNTEKFYLVEIKNSSSGKRSKKRQDAVYQLETTVKLLMQNDISFENFDTKAIICFRRDNEHPVQASRNTKRALFLEKYKISLDEGNRIEF